MRKTDQNKRGDRQYLLCGARNPWRHFWSTQRRRYSICCRSGTQAILCPSSKLCSMLEKIEAASKKKGTVTGIPAGSSTWTTSFSGLQPSDLVLVAARPSMGKTAFVLNIAQYMALKKDKGVAIFSLEMSKEQLVNRLFSMESRWIPRLEDRKYVRLRLG